MSSFKSDFLNIITQRGFIHQMSDANALDQQLANSMTTAYIGFDCTAKSLHIGGMLQIMLLYWLQQCGHRPFVLIGSGTTRVGDPGGRDETRPILGAERIEENKLGIRRCFDKFLTFGQRGNDAIMADNADWLLHLNYVDFLRDVGRHFSVNQMLARDSVSLRLQREQHLSFLEFNYMVLQAYDFVELSRRFDCRLQMGGSDQWGNIVSGVDLGRRMATKQLFALTAPLITTASGAKMGKSVGGAIWIDQGMRSTYDFWQYWRNVEDGDVVRFMRLFTTMDLAEICRYAQLQGAEINDAKKKLADAVTELVHGKHAAALARQTAEQTFEQGKLGADLPKIEVDTDALDRGLGLLGALVSAGLCSSNSDARRQVRGGAIRVNDASINDEAYRLMVADITDGIIKLSKGKKKHVLLVPRSG